MSAPTTPAPLTTPEQRAQFEVQARDRVTVVAALHAAHRALYDAANHETGITRRVLHFLAERISRAGHRKADRLRGEFFPQAVQLLVAAPMGEHPPYGSAVVVVDGPGGDELETVYEAHPAAEARDALYLAVEDHQAVTDPALDHQAAEKIATHAATAIPRVLEWLRAAERAGRAEAALETEREQEHREYVAARTCSKCGERGRGVEERDIPHDEYDVRTAGEWLETNDGLILCDSCGHRWWVQ